jgi:acetyl esterase/lipase
MASSSSPSCCGCLSGRVRPADAEQRRITSLVRSAAAVPAAAHACESERRSLLARTLGPALNLLGFKSRLTSSGALMKSIKKRRAQGSVQPAWLRPSKDEWAVEELAYGGGQQQEGPASAAGVASTAGTCDLYVYRPRPPRATTGAAPPPPAAADAVLFLHGGCYTFGPVAQHFELAVSLSRALGGCPVLLPTYPLAPEHSAPEALEAALAAWGRAAKEGPRVVVMGDSAGGGLGLALSQHLAAAKAAAQKKTTTTQGGGAPLLPSSLVLISPWLDVTLEDPRVMDVDPRDGMLGVLGLREAGRLYAGKLGVTHPIPSPARGPLRGLPPTTIFMGGDDILEPDCSAFAERWWAEGKGEGEGEGEGNTLRYFRDPGLQHDYLLMSGFLAEGKEALAVACESVRQDGEGRG